MTFNEHLKIMEIRARLHKIRAMFYDNEDSSEAHFELGRLVEYVKNITFNCDDVNNEPQV